MCGCQPALLKLVNVPHPLNTGQPLLISRKTTLPLEMVTETNFYELNIEVSFGVNSITKIIFAPEFQVI